MDRVIVAVFGGALIAFIYWFFFGKKEETVVASDQIRIAVDGGYNPASIKLQKGKTTTLLVTRKDQNSCLEEIVLPEFKTKKYLPLNEEVEIKLTPEKSGEFPFHCGMNMYHGKIIVD